MGVCKYRCTYSHGDSSNWDSWSGWANSLKFVQVTWKPLMWGQWPNSWLDPLLSSSFKGVRLYLSRITFPVPAWCTHFSAGVIYNSNSISSQEHGFRFLGKKHIHSWVSEPSWIKENRPAWNGFRAFVEIGSRPVPPEVQGFLWQRFFHCNCIVITTMITTWTWLAGWLNEWMNAWKSVYIDSRVKTSAMKRLTPEGFLCICKRGPLKWTGDCLIIFSTFIGLHCPHLSHQYLTVHSQVYHFQRSCSGLRL